MLKILLIQENGRHNENRHFRECFCLQRAFIKLNQECDVWGLGHNNINDNIDYESYDLIINLENYNETGWVPNLSKVKTTKFLWSIDAHVKGEEGYIKEYNRGNYDILLHSTKDYVNKDYKIWFPNSFDDTLISPRNAAKKCDLGFCGNLLNRNNYIDLLSSNFSFIFDNFVIGDSMVNAINSYKIHWNCNLSNDINYRSFETIGCGIPLVTNYNYQYEELGFIDGVNVMMYKDNNEMILKIKQLLSNDKLRESIGKSGLELSKKHTYEKRCETLINLYTTKI
jgi:hypothetical protein